MAFPDAADRAETARTLTLGIAASTTGVANNAAELPTVILICTGMARGWPGKVAVSCFDRVVA